MQPTLRLLSVMALSLALAACGSSGKKKEDNAINNNSYLQFYNGSANSVRTNMFNGNSKLASARYGESTRAYKVKDGDIKFKLTNDGSGNSSKEIKKETIKVGKGEKALVLLSGDYDNAELVTHKFKRKKYTKQFTITATSVVKGATTYDMYFAKSGVAFDKSKKIGNLNYQKFSTAKSSAKNGYWAQGDYVVYLTEPGKKKIMFQSPLIKMNTATEYMAIVRHVSDIDKRLVLDLVTNSSSTRSYSHINAPVKYRVYNSLDDKNLQVQLVKSQSSSEPVLDIKPNTLSALKTIDFGDYQLSVKDNSQTLLQNVLLSLQQGKYKSVVLFNDADNKLSSIEVEESLKSQSKEHDVNIVNLSTKYDKVDIYFVRDNETISSAKYKVTKLGKLKTQQLRIPNGHYEVVAIHKQSTDKTLLLYRTQKLAFNQAKNYLITLEPETQAPTGYQLRVNF